MRKRQAGGSLKHIPSSSSSLEQREFKLKPTAKTSKVETDKDTKPAAMAQS
jgi:hypothetical protein